MKTTRRVLALLDARPPAYVGALGPAPRREWLLEEVAANGARLSAALLERLRGPVGLDLGDRSPAGIALAVAAEILALFNGRDARPLVTKMATQTSATDRRVCHV